ncbi:MAG: NF038120 family PEP-CTERM protein [Rubrivivax sp.]
MIRTFGRLLCTAGLIASFGSPLAQAATVIDFEGEALTGLYFAGDSFVDGDYTLTARFDYGIVDVAASLGAVSPSGNATQFYFNSNDGALSLARSDGSLFDLSGFSAAFVPLDPAPLQTTVIVAVGTKQDNTTVTASWSFASSATSHFPFSSYSGAAFAAFSNLKQVEFRACSLVGSAICTVATQNNGQFAIDNILVAAPVPEPSTTLLLTLGLLGLGLRARRAALR